MIEAPRPANESERLAALLAYDVLDTDPEQGFDDLTTLASRICQMPISLVSLVDSERQWFKSRVGLEATETARSVAFCSHAILEPDEVLIVPNALADPRFADNPLVVGDPRVLSYAGAPLVTPEGMSVGTLCVIDHQPRQLTAAQIDALRRLAGQVVTQLELRLKYNEAKHLAVRLGLVNRELSRRNEEIKTFYHTLAHELKTPLTAARERISMLAEGVAGPVSDSQIDHLSAARDCCDQITVHVNDLLDMTRLETGKLAMVRRPECLGRITSEVTGAAEREALKRGLSLTCRVEPDLPEVLVDRTRMSQVLGNLVNNALKFTPPGGRVEVRAARIPDIPGFVAVEVIDTGVGMGKEHLDRVFDRLYQVSRDDSAGKGGLGIGLSLCREIVRMHGGEIRVKSRPGEGSTFWFSVPTVQGVIEEAA